MRINAIGNNSVVNKYNTPHFTGLIKDKSALSVINRMSDGDKVELRQIEQRIAKTKYWDMKISTLSNKFNELKFRFINKKNNNNIITDGIYPYERQGDTIRFYTIVYGPENTSCNTVETLKFKTEKIAEELFDKYQQNALYSRNRGYNITPIESIKMKEVELNMLEEASETTQGKRKIKPIVTKINTKSFVGNELLK